MPGFTINSPQILARLHQSDFAPYVSGLYNAQWNAPVLLHDKHMLHLGHILDEMEVKGPWLGSWLPLTYGVDTGVSQHRTLELARIPCIVSFSQNPCPCWCFGSS